MILNPKYSAKKVLELINEFSKVVGYKIIIRNQLYIQSHSQLLPKKNLGINLIEGVKDQIIKMSILPKAIYRFNAIPMKIPMTFHGTRTNISKIYIEPQKAPHMVTAILRKKNKVGGIMLPNINYNISPQ